MDAEKIRLKRLAKLSSPLQTAPVANEPTVPVPVKEPTVAKKTASVPVLSHTELENKEIQKLLSVSLLQSRDYKQLPDLAGEFQQEGRQLLLTQDTLDRIFMARLLIGSSSDNSDDLESSSLFRYLYSVWMRSYSAASRTSSMNDLHAKVMDLSLAYAGIVLKYPDTFPQPEHILTQGASVMKASLLADPDTKSGLSQDFLRALVQKFENDGLDEIFAPVLTSLSAEARLSKLSSTSFVPVLRALGVLVSEKQVAALVTQLPSFNPPNLPPRTMEVATFLGPFLRMTSFGTDDAELAQSMFGMAHQRTRSNIETATHSLRLALENLQSMMYQIILLIIKASPASKDAVLTFFGTVLDRNVDRGKMHIQDFKTVSSDGFMMNCYAVMLHLCDPFLDSSFSKLNLIDAEYLKACRRFSPKHPTKLNSTPEEEKAYYDENQQQEGKPSNFVTEVFFMTLAFHHLSVHRSFLTLKDINRNIKELQKAVEEMKAEVPSLVNTPNYPVFLQHLKRYEAELDRLMSVNLTCNIQLQDPKTTTHILQFLHLVMRFLLKVATAPSFTGTPPAGYAQGPHFRLPATISLPLSASPPMCFRMYPEFFVEDIAEYVMHTTRFDPESLASSAGSSFLDELMSFALVFLISKSGASVGEDNVADQKKVFVKNPYLISKLVEVLFSFTWDYGGQSQLQSVCRNLFAAHPLATKYLPMGLINFWVDVEKTGLSNQFYEKFGIRYNISQIMKLLWTEYPSLYRERVRLESVERWDTFVKFVNLLMNDTTYLLDESLGSLADIHKLQDEMSAPEFASLTNEAKKEKVKHLQDLDRRAQSTCQLGNETVHMLQYLTEYIVDPFLRPEIIDRLASMLNYNLVQLVGPKCIDLKVKNPEKYQFNPRALLSDILDIYIHLAPATRVEFATAVARDGRSYNAAHFHRAGSILLGRGLKPQPYIDTLSKFVSKCEQVLINDRAEEEELGDIPDEFLDPLMYTIMEDPVILPGSKQTIDRSTIQSHLLSDSTDPFNRQPLEYSQLIANTELKAKIAEWKAGKRKA